MGYSIIYRMFFILIIDICKLMSTIEEFLGIRMTWGKLERELEEIRKNGVAFDHEECFEGICAVAAPLLGPNGEIATISIVVPRERFAAIEESLAGTLVDRGHNLQTQIR